MLDICEMKINEFNHLPHINLYRQFPMVINRSLYQKIYIYIYSSHCTQAYLTLFIFLVIKNISRRYIFFITRKLMSGACVVVVQVQGQILTRLMNNA